MNTISQPFKRFWLASMLSAGLVTISGLSQAQVVFDFEGTNPLNSSLVTGDKANFGVTVEQAHGGSKSLKFAPPALEPYKSFTYDIPMDDFTSGIISVWFYDTRGAANTGFADTHKVGGAIILEDKNDLQNFVAVEVADAPYPVVGGGPFGPIFSPAYYGTEGIDSLISGAFDSGLAKRTIGFHKVEFHVSAAETRLFVDGIQSTKVAGPGSSTAELRLRIMNDSPSELSQVAGEDWTVSPHSESWGTTETWVFYDDIQFLRELPSFASDSHGFEKTPGGDPTYDAYGVATGNAVPPPFDNPNMNGFINYWDVTTSAAVVRSGSQAAYFVNSTPRLQTLSFDLTGVQPETTATVWFYDVLGGTQTTMDKAFSIFVEDVNDPGKFLAVEIDNMPYPYSGGGPRYYCLEGTPGNPFDTDLENDPYTDFWSGAFPVRSTGWHRVDFVFRPTNTTVYVDGQIGHRNNINNIAVGPGLDKTLRLRIMADTVGQGAYGNYTSAINELSGVTWSTRNPYVYVDDITLPLPPGSSVGDWQMY